MVPDGGNTSTTDIVYIKSHEIFSSTSDLYTDITSSQLLTKEVVHHNLTIYTDRV